MARNPFTPENESFNPRSDDGAEELDLDREGPDPSEYADDADESETRPCPQCGADIYDLADQCPHCSAYVTPGAGPLAKLNPWILGIGALALLGLLLALLLR